MSEKCGEYDKAMTYLIWVCCAPRKGKLDFTVPRSRRLSLQRSHPFRRHGHGLVGHIAWARWILKTRALRASMSIAISGEEGERKQLVAAVEDGYVLCQWVFHSVLTFSSLFSKLNGFIQASKYEYRFKSSSHLLKFHAAAARMSSITANNLFNRDELL